MFERGIVPLLTPVLLATACSSEPSANELKEQQLAQACMVVNMWPTDVAIVWGPTSERARAKGESPAEAMANYVNLQSLVAGDLTEPEAIELVEDYKNYWFLLEQDLIANPGQTPQEDWESTKEGSRLLQYCAKYDPEMRDGLQ